MEILNRIKKFRMALFCGLLLALSFPNFLYPELFWGFDLLAFFSLLPLFMDIGRDRPGLAFKKGYVAGLLFFLLSLYWILHVKPMGPGALPAWIGLSAYLALYPALFFGGVAWGLKRSWPFQALWIPALWTVLEALREILLTGFPWVSLGSSQTSNLSLLPLVSVTGVYGLHFAVVLGNILAWKLLRPLEWKRREWFGAVLAIALLIGLRFQAPARPQGAPTVKVAVLQGNIDQDHDWTADYRRELMTNYFAMMTEAADAGAKVLIWPESSFPGIFGRGDPEEVRLLEFARSRHLALIFGATLEAPGERNFSNAAVFIDSSGNVSTYAKRHLVPFGETIPFRARLPVLDQMLRRIGLADFKEGPGPVAFESEGFRLSPLVCYESIYGEAARESGIGALAIITLDTWFGNSPAPRYHMGHAILRAVESGRWVARAAATGVSCFVSPEGRVLARQPLNTRGWIMQEMDCASSQTPYQRYGAWFVGLCALLLVLAVITGKTLISKGETPELN
ncbi:MAG: apolipoprotein N-acyltransferase [candidate division FCPU426 bacterium]